MILCPLRTASTGSLPASSRNWDTNPSSLLLDLLLLLVHPHVPGPPRERSLLSEPTQRSISPENAAKLLSTVTALPPLWVGLMCLVAIVAAVDVTKIDNGGFRWHASLGAVSLVAIGLIWLPTAVRFLILAGGSLKAAGVEAKTAGLLTSPDEFINDLANLRTTAEPIRDGTDDLTAAARRIDTVIDNMASRYLSADDVLSEEVLNREAREYERIRRTMSAGQERTTAMNRLVNEVRIRAAAAPAAASRYAQDSLRSARAGDRIVGLALVEGAPSADQFGDVLRVFSTSASAFEQYHSLLALKEIAPALSAVQRREAVTVLETEKTDPRGVGLMNDAYIPSWIDAVLDLIQTDPDRRITIAA